MVILWLGRALLGGGSGRMVSGGGHGSLPSAGGLFFLSLFLVAGGFLLWKALTLYFWRKYFPAQDPPPVDRRD